MYTWGYVYQRCGCIGCMDDGMYYVLRMTLCIMCDSSVDVPWFITGIDLNFVSMLIMDQCVSMLIMHGDHTNAM